VICTGTQRRQTQAICDAILESLHSAGERAGHVEGYERGDWILLDLSDLVVHVFTPETRHFYGLERLWGDAPPLAPWRPDEARAARPVPSGDDGSSPASVAERTSGREAARRATRSRPTVRRGAGGRRGR